MALSMHRGAHYNRGGDVLWQGLIDYVVASMHRGAAIVLSVTALSMLSW